MIPVVLDDHLVMALLIPLVDKSLTMLIYQPYNVPILDPHLENIFQHGQEGRYTAITYAHA